MRTIGNIINFLVPFAAHSVTSFVPFSLVGRTDTIFSFYRWERLLITKGILKNIFHQEKYAVICPFWRNEIDDRRCIVLSAVMVWNGIDFRFENTVALFKKHMFFVRLNIHLPSFCLAKSVDSIRELVVYCQDCRDCWMWKANFI